MTQPQVIEVVAARPKTVSVVRVPQRVMVRTVASTVSVVAVPRRVAVHGVGVQGPPGPPGPPGTPGGAYVTHTQGVPSASWVVPHSLGRLAAVTLLVDDREVLADVSQSPGFVNVQFPEPVAGVALLT